MIRRAEERDREIYYEMADDFYHSDAVIKPIAKEKIKAGFDMMITDNPYLTGYIIEHEGKPAGYGIISEKFETEVGGITVWIEDVYVKSEYRGRGLGG
ncbi:MAG: GNAT family N-acetyltransferase, partial [Clostridiales bacterium]|nr:GNAT family N-acetyltransferase [Clostridiales bacterium]